MTSFMNSTGPIPRINQQDLLDVAGHLVDKHLQEDRQYLELSDLLKVVSHGQPSSSGLSDFDYPNLSDAQLGIDSLPELSPVKRVPLPPELVEQFSRVQCRCLMGLFPQIERAWLTIDSDIFIWRFEDGSDLAYFDGLGETILSVALVQPKPQIFESRIQYLLCIATSIDIVLLGVTFTQPNLDRGDVYSGEMHLLPEPLFSIPTDKFMLHITSTQSGRIFMSAKDGYVYELLYQADDGWFSRKCRLVNHSTGVLSLIVPSFLTFSFTDDDPLVQISIDDSRNLLYTRSEKGTIQMYDMGADGRGMSRVAVVRQQAIVQQAALIARTIDRSNFKPLVHIAAVTRADSSNVHLMAITETGVRLYFSGQAYNSAKSRPSFLTLVHVRLPPGYSANLSTRKPTNIHMAYYRRGTVLLASSITDDTDVMWCMSADSFPFQKQLMESQVTVPVDGHTWDICELPYPPFGYNMATTTPAGDVCSDPPLVVTQHIEMPRKFVILNSQGTYIVTKMRPVDQLRQLLVNAQGVDTGEVSAFFKLHKIDQACATCLILACSKLHSDLQVSEWAKIAFFMYGGEASYGYITTPQSMTPANVGPMSQQTSYMPQSMMAPPHNQSVMFSSSAYQPNITIGSPGVFQPAQASTPQGRLAASSHTPIGPQQQQLLANQSQQYMRTPNVRQAVNLSQNPSVPYGVDLVYSGKHNGICTYISRILRPFWDTNIVTPFPQKTPNGTVIHLTCTFRSDELAYVLDLMQDLSDFIQHNSQFDSPLQAESLSGPDMLGTPRPMMQDITRKKLSNDAEQLEKLSLQKIYLLVSRICEVLGLLNVFLDHQFHVLASALTTDQQNQLSSLTFKQLVINGKEMCGALVLSLIKRYHDDNATTDMISTRLRETCPSLYSCEDAVCSKASELLKAARLAMGPLEKQTRLSEALDLYKQVVATLHLPTVCNSFAGAHFYEGIVDLCATAAQKRDPHNLALHCYKTGEHLEDKLTSQAYFTRMECYECVVETLTYLHTVSMSQPSLPSIPTSPGVMPTPTESVHALSPLEAEQYKEKVLQLCQKSDDELFHVAIYDWLIKHNLTDRLLQIQAPYVETFLKTQAGTSGDDTVVISLLWKYYEKVGNFSAASRILARLSERHSNLSAAFYAVFSEYQYFLKRFREYRNDVPLRERVEFLSRAIICVKSSTTSVRSATDGEFLHELEEKMEVSRLQMQVYDELSNITPRPVSVQEALSRLDSDLLDITTLYEDFADRFQLYACKLAIVHCASLNDPPLIEDLWLNIINKIFCDTNKTDVHSRMFVIETKIVGVAKLYSSATQYFPVAFIVKHLEQRSTEAKFDQSWTFQCLLKADVKFSQLYEIYDRQFRSRDPFWQSTRLHTLSVIQSLIAAFVDTPSLVPPHERRMLTNVIRDNVSHYLVELQAMSNTDRTVSGLSHKYRRIMSQLAAVLL